MQVDSTINTISNGKEFSFSGCNIYCMMYWFSNNSFSSINMWDWGGYIIFDTGIWGNERVFKDIIESISISIYKIRVFLIYWKRKMIRESIY